MALRSLLRLWRHPRTLRDSILTYPRFLGAIKVGTFENNPRELEARLSWMRGGWWPAKLKSPVGRNILCVSPHADDETIGAGGLLISHREIAKISVITIFDGKKGGRSPHNGQVGLTLADIRKRELVTACSYFAGHFAGSLDLPERSQLGSDHSAAAKLRDFVEGIKPDVVILPWLLDEHPDHRATNLLWSVACADLDCMVLGTEIWSLSTPNAFFDISDVLPLKLAAIAEFKSQLETVDYLSLAEGLARTRAFHFGFRHRRTGAAEAFFTLPNEAYCELVSWTLVGGRQTVGVAV